MVEYNPTVVGQLTLILSSYQVPRAIQVAAHLGIGGLLRARARSAVELAASTGTDSTVLDRVLQVLVAAQVVTYEDGQYGRTALSDHLELFDQPFFGDEAWRCWGELASVVVSGESPFERLYGQSLFDYLNHDPDERDRWNMWNTLTAAAWLQPLIPAIRVAPGETLVDVGGGEGALLAAVLEANPQTSGVLVDLPEVVERAGALLRAQGVEDRCRIEGGDAFVAVPPGADVYLVSRVLFNWSDDEATRLLQSVRGAMSARSRLYIIENVVGDEGLGRFAANNLHLFVVFNSHHHTERQLRDICQAAGLSIVEVHAPPTGSLFSLIEAVVG
jgi:hypothetical protein